MYKKILLTLCLTLLVLSVVKSQVTIGSSHIPQSGALLDLKEDNNLGANSKRGLGLPRVYLESNSTIEMQGAAALPASEYINHTGLMVYNIHQKDGTQISAVSEMLCPGIHVWNGEKWTPLTAYPQNTTYCDGTLPEPDATIAITETSVNLLKGASIQLTAVVTPSTATGTITWSSNNPLVTVSATGVVSAVGVTTDPVQITATFTHANGSSTSAPCLINTAELKATITTTNVKLLSGQEQTMVLNVTPSWATNLSYSWTSNNTAAVTVDTSGKLIAQPNITNDAGAGIEDATVKITASVTSGTITSNSHSVDVKAATLKTTIGSTTNDMLSGTNQTLTAQVTPSWAGTTSAGVLTYTWTSGTPTLATVSADGTVTPAANIATPEGESVNINLSVKAGTIAAPASKTLRVGTLAVSIGSGVKVLSGNKATLTKVLTPSWASVASYAWSTQNASLATINETTGEVTPVDSVVNDAGQEDANVKMSVTATVGSITATNTTDIKVATLAIAFSKTDKESLLTGMSTPLTHTVTPSWGGGATVAYDAALATYNGTTLAAGANIVPAAGTDVTITATTNSLVDGSPLTATYTARVGTLRTAMVRQTKNLISLDMGEGVGSTYGFAKLWSHTPSWATTLGTLDTYGWTSNTSAVTFEERQYYGVVVVAALNFPGDGTETLNKKATVNYSGLILTLPDEQEIIATPTADAKTCEVTVYSANPYQMTDTRDAANPQKYWIGYMSSVSIDSNDVVNWGNRNSDIHGGWWMLENLRADRMPNGEAIDNQILQNQLGTPGYVVATKPEYGYFYNWAAATNRKGGPDGSGNVDNPDGSGQTNNETDIEPSPRQGVCPDGFVLPSNNILRPLSPLSHQYIRPSEGAAQVSRTIMAQGEGIDLNTGLSKTPAEGGFSYYYTGYFNAAIQNITGAGTQASGFWSNSGGPFNTQANFVHSFSYSSPSGGSRGAGWRYDGRTVRCVSAAK